MASDGSIHARSTTRIFGPGLVDQPPDVLGLGGADEITADEFESA